jgi:hypothetical protein
MLKRHVGYSARGVGERMLLVDGEVCRVRGHGLTHLLPFPCAFNTPSNVPLSGNTPQSCSRSWDISDKEI